MVQACLPTAESCWGALGISPKLESPKPGSGQHCQNQCPRSDRFCWIQIILPECDQIINLHTKKCPQKVKENHKTLEQKGLFWVLIFLNVKSCIADLYYCKVLTFLFYVSFFLSFF